MNPPCEPSAKPGISKPMLSWEFNVVKSDNDELLGKKHFVNNFFEENQIGFLKKNIKIAGREDVKPSDLQDPYMRDTFLDIEIEFEVVETNKDGKKYLNTYFRKLVKGYTPKPNPKSEELSSADLGIDDGLPF